MNLDVIFRFKDDLCFIPCWALAALLLTWFLGPPLLTLLGLSVLSMRFLKGGPGIRKRDLSVRAAVLRQLGNLGLEPTGYLRIRCWCVGTCWLRTERAVFFGAETLRWVAQVYRRSPQDLDRTIILTGFGKNVGLWTTNDPAWGHGQAPPGRVVQVIDTQHIRQLVTKHQEAIDRMLQEGHTLTENNATPPLGESRWGLLGWGSWRNKVWQSYVLGMYLLGAAIATATIYTSTKFDPLESMIPLVAILLIIVLYQGHQLWTAQLGNDPASSIEDIDDPGVAPSSDQPIPDAIQEGPEVAYRRSDP